MGDLPISSPINTEHSDSISSSWKSSISISLTLFCGFFLQLSERMAGVHRVSGKISKKNAQREQRKIT